MGLKITGRNLRRPPTLRGVPYKQISSGVGGGVKLWALILGGKIKGSKQQLVGMQASLQL